LPNKKPNRKGPRASGKEPRPTIGRAAQEIRLRKSGDGWELVHPRCACDRAEDIEEVQAMVAGGEIDIARDELLYLVDGCREFIDGHKLLGELAYAEGDIKLARGHFGYAFRLGQDAIHRAGNPRPVLYSLPANQAFHESGKALALCLLQLERREVAAELLEQMLSYDPNDPLGVAALIR
jgi:tetratricopeptide (TPR) repeat protein